jgi:hypothetical protein
MTHPTQDNNTDVRMGDQIKSTEDNITGVVIEFTETGVKVLWTDGLISRVSFQAMTSGRFERIGA